MQIVGDLAALDVSAQLLTHIEEQITRANQPADESDQHSPVRRILIELREAKTKASFTTSESSIPDLKSVLNRGRNHEWRRRWMYQYTRKARSWLNQSLLNHNITKLVKRASNDTLPNSMTFS